MKKLLLALLSIVLLCGCRSNNGATKTSSDLLVIEEGYERRAEQMSLSGIEGAISAATLQDNKLWFVCEQVLYTANSDGSDAREVFGNVPDKVKFIAFGADGDIYFGGDRDVRVFNKDGAKKSQFTFEDSGIIQLQTIFDLFTSIDGEPVALIRSENGFSSRAVTSEAFGSAVDYNLPIGVSVTGISFYDGTMLLASTDGLSAYSGADFSDIFNWSDIGVGGGEAYLAGVTEDETIIYLNRYEECLYTIVPKLFKRTELTIAANIEGTSVSSDLSILVAGFNASNNEYKINIVKYDSLEELNLQIIAGNTPDLIQIATVFPFDNFVTKGLFEDLNPFFDNDPEVALVPTIHRILSSDEKLFRVCPGFNVLTFAGSSDFVGTEPGWTFEEMRQCLAEAPEGATVLPAYWEKGNILTFILYQNIDEYVDWESGTALFDSSDFKALLEYVNTNPNDPPPYQEDDGSLLLEGRQLVEYGMTPWLEAPLSADIFYGGKASYKGFPSSDRNTGILATSSITLVMTSVCAEKDGAWSFIRYVLLNDENFQEIPTVQSRFDIAVQAVMTEPRFDLPPMTWEQYEKFMDFLDGIESVLSQNVALQTIIEEELPAYFYGDKTVDEVCEIIQNRAQVYVWEQG